jgi:cation:H+ antiporter
LPVVYAISSIVHSEFNGGLPLDALQREELFVTAAQSAFAVAVLANRSINTKEAWALLGLFMAQFILGAVLAGHLRDDVRIIVGVVYLGLAGITILRDRRSVPRVLHDGFREPYAAMALERSAPIGS